MSRFTLAPSVAPTGSGTDRPPDPEPGPEGPGYVYEARCTGCWSSPPVPLPPARERGAESRTLRHGTAINRCTRPNILFAPQLPTGEAASWECGIDPLITEGGEACRFSPSSAVIFFTPDRPNCDTPVALRHPALRFLLPLTLQTPAGPPLGRPLQLPARSRARVRSARRGERGHRQ